MLNINNLSVFVGRKNVVRNVSLAVRPGEIHALMGPNGSGKSSLAMALAGHPAYKLLTPDSRLKMDGEDITNKTPDERARLGLFLAMQYPVGIGGVTVEQLLRSSVISSDPSTGGESRDLAKRFKSSTTLRSGLDSSTQLVLSAVEGLGMTRKPIDVLQFRRDLGKLAEKVGVNRELLFRSINVGFSGGEKKRLEVLQMLVLQPKYAILDETDSGLDIDALRTIAKNIRLFANSNLKTQISNPKLKSQNRPGILVITHYARLLKHLQPDYVHIMKSGEIVETGGKKLAERIEKEGYKGGISN